MNSKAESKGKSSKGMAKNEAESKGESSKAMVKNKAESKGESFKGMAKNKAESKGESTKSPIVNDLIDCFGECEDVCHCGESFGNECEIRSVSQTFKLEAYERR